MRKVRGELVASMQSSEKAKTQVPSIDKKVKTQIPRLDWKATAQVPRLDRMGTSAR